jgi:hypothetical protein
MAKYVFCPWPPTNSVAKTIRERTKEWTKERAAKGKEGYDFVCWMGKTVQVHTKIGLMDDDQVYIKGHHQQGEGFISDVTKQEEAEIQKSQDQERHGKFYATKLKPEDLAWRFFDCFEAPITWLGKIKFYNCSSGANGGASFAKPAADRLRAYFPLATYIGYRMDLSQGYTNYNVDERELPEGKQEVRSLQRLLGEKVPPIQERRKQGVKSVVMQRGGKPVALPMDIRAKKLQEEIRL